MSDQNTPPPPLSSLWMWTLPVLALSGALWIALSDTNVSIFLLLNRLSELTGSHLWAHITIYGDTLVALTLCLPLALRRVDILWAALLAGGITALLVRTLKPLLDIPRPPALLDHIHLIGPLLRTQSFPSGHTATAFVLAGVVILNLSPASRRRWAWWLLGGAMLVGISRAAVGVHWPLDILCGAACGWFGAVVGSLWMRHWAWGRVGRGRVWSVGLFVLAAMLLMFYDTRYPGTAWLQWSIAVFALASVLLPCASSIRACLEHRSQNPPQRVGKCWRLWLRITKI